MMAKLWQSHVCLHGSYAKMHGGHGSFPFRSPFVPFCSRPKEKSQCISLKQHTAERSADAWLGLHLPISARN
jgi:hypothetical protein